MNDTEESEAARMEAHWYTGEFCPCCENAIMYTNGWQEWCEGCGYSRKPVDAPLDSDDDWHIAGLA